MKLLLAIPFAFIGFFSSAQCVICTSLTDALKDPQRTISLDLSAQGLSEIPLELNKFSNLEELNLSDNQILEVDFSKVYLPHLEQLNLANNPGFNGAAMNSIDKALPKLKRLDLSGNAMQLLHDDLTGLKELNELYLSNNNLKYFSSAMDAIGSLKILDVENNNFEDQPMLFAQLWNLEQLNIAGNPNLRWGNLTGSLLFKDNLKTLETTIQASGGVPKGFKNISITHLIIVDTEFDQMSNAIAMNDSIQSLVLENCTVNNPVKFYAWIDRFKNLKSLEFKEMDIPAGIKQLENIEELVFNNCDFEDKLEIAQIKPQVNVLSKNCDISNGDFQGNAKKFRMVSIPQSQYVEKNSLPIIKEIEAKEFTVSGSDSSKIDLGFSAYEIPKNAFLDQSGNVYEGQVMLKIKELNDPIKNALAGIPMVYNNGSDQLFGSSGMIDIRAMDENGNELFPNPENQIMVELDDIQPSKSNELYVFNPQLNNWELIGKPKSTDMDSLRKAIMDSLAKISDADLIGVRTIPIVIQLKYKKKRYDPTELTFSYADNNFSFQKGNKNKRHYYTRNIDQKAICNTTWKLDSVNSKALDSLLRKSKVEQKSIAKLLKKPRKSAYPDIPRLITNLKINPNIERDNYTMTFSYRDREYVLPVYREMSGNIETVQRKEKRYYSTYKKKQIKSGKEAAKTKKEQDEYIKKYADIQRSIILNNLIRNRSYIQENVDKLRFGLSTFGLINCDYFTRNVPVANIALDSVAVDQDGNFVYVPFDIRNVVIDDNTFVSTFDRSFPIFNRMRSIPLFALGALEVCVIKTWKKLSNGLFRAEVFRFSTANLSSDEVREKILNN